MAEEHRQVRALKLLRRRLQCCLPAARNGHMYVLFRNSTYDLKTFGIAPLPSLVLPPNETRPYTPAHMANTQAFQTGDLSSLRGLLTSCSRTTPAGVNYRRRLGDATTALMAAAFHGDLDTVRHLLSLGAQASLVDAGGRSAAMFAGMRGHRECFAELQRVAGEEEKEQRARTTKRRGFTPAAGGGGGGAGGAGDDGHDFVYDLYYFEPSASKSSTEGASASGGEGGTGVPTASSKVGERVSLSV